LMAHEMHEIDDQTRLALSSEGALNVDQSE
jgi:hypothetical protein